MFARLWQRAVNKFLLVVELTRKRVLCGLWQHAHTSMCAQVFRHQLKWLAGVVANNPFGHDQLLLGSTIACVVRCISKQRIVTCVHNLLETT